MITTAVMFVMVILSLIICMIGAVVPVLLVMLALHWIADLLLVLQYGCTHILKRG